MRRLGVLAAALTLGAVLLMSTAPGADAQERGAVAVCNWENFTQYGHDGYNWHWMGCNYSLFGRAQCRGGDIPRCWTTPEAKREVRAFRAWTGLG